MTLNAHRIFTGPVDADHYLAALTLETDRINKLRDARDACREGLRSGLRNWSTLVNDQLLFERAIVASAPTSLKPKFKMQGSFAYRTLNDPAKAPPQEIDLDDGVFVPVSFLSDHGRVHPALISSGYFKAVEAALKPVCDAHGWTLDTDKSSCVRVRLDDGAHIDFALYAIPDAEFEELVEAAAATRVLADESRLSLHEQLEFAETVYQNLREDQIMLAHRTEGWKPSDPRKLGDWFRAALKMHDEQLRRVCRYLKGWRDFQWEASRLSSISLMVCVVTTYDEAATPVATNRDDLALLAVCERLPGLLAKPIANPVVPGQFLDEGWSDRERQTMIAAAEELLQRVQEALRGTDSADRALESLVCAFGDRLPDNPALIISETAPEVSMPGVLTSGLVKEWGKENAPDQPVKREGERRYG
ncbi:CBASS cGAMP synthase [Xanthobacter wiegelii]|uniref:CBASS cGAMP synthase n=1 Tax=Xanthobacter wiegelii TaxID=3119913 RepID=UPI00372C8697